MSSANPIPILKVDVNKLSLRKPKKENTNNATGKAYHLYHGDQKLIVVWPEMTAPFGAGNSEKYPEKFTMSLSFEGCPKTHEKAKAIADKIQDLILDQRAELFPKDAKLKKQPSIDVIKSRYKHFIQPGDENQGYADRINLSIQRHVAPEGTPDEEKLAIEREFKSLDNGPLLIAPDGTQIQVDTENCRAAIPYRCRIKAVSEFAYLWVLGSSQECYPVWTFVQGLLVSTKSVSTFNILDQDDDEEVSNAAATTSPMEVDGGEGESPTTDHHHDGEPDGTEVMLDDEDAHLAAAAL